jgi:hypothetical protein
MVVEIEFPARSETEIEAEALQRARMVLEHMRDRFGSDDIVHYHILQLPAALR